MNCWTVFVRKHNFFQYHSGFFCNIVPKKFSLSAPKCNTSTLFKFFKTGEHFYCPIFFGFPKTLFYLQKLFRNPKIRINFPDIFLSVSALFFRDKRYSTPLKVSRKLLLISTCNFILPRDRQNQKTMVIHYSQFSITLSSKTTGYNFSIKFLIKRIVFVVGYQKLRSWKLLSLQELKRKILINAQTNFVVHKTFYWHSHPDSLPVLVKPSQTRHSPVVLFLTLFSPPCLPCDIQELLTVKSYKGDPTWR